jgi:hypothetical protein
MRFPKCVVSITELAVFRTSKMGHLSDQELHALCLAFLFLERLCGLVSEYLATDPEVQVRFPALPDFLRSSGSGTGFTQPREYS